MLVGGSLYGWGTASLKKELLKQGVNQAVEEAWKYWDEGNCPLAAVIAHWGSDLATGKSHWNMRRSQFWMTARDVVNGLALPSTEYPSWFSRLPWTNLYKVNPARTGNPGGPLVEAQHELLIATVKASNDLGDDLRLYIGALGGRQPTGKMKFGKQLKSVIRNPRKRKVTNFPQQAIAPPLPDILQITRNHVLRSKPLSPKS
jgi:hypothetical protein